MVRFSAEACAILDGDLVVRAANSAARREFGLCVGINLADLTDAPDVIAQLIAPCFASTAPHALALALHPGPTVEATGWRIGGAFASQRLIGLRLSGEARLRGLIHSRIEKARQKNIQLRRNLSTLTEEYSTLATRIRHDPMTGVLTREAFVQSLERDIANGRGFSLAMVDMDGLKRINDRDGHLVGDAAIRRLATALLGLARPQDRVGRFGGDEFAVRMSAALPPDATQRFRTELNSVLAGQDARSPLSASVGFTVWLGDGDSAEAAIDRADRDMYLAKQVAKEKARRVSAPGP
ncbi:GGDEF domain-containing protein [Loktanella sp. IMCC34160]|uniref:sensor domain-containing diguanylate cyclase n=1 Tax=Loktanella sp. IMCC34160 TaxID=2510646 RepID=UPI0013EA0A42|nr:GGDEF domain-containing protein [Loktanella sp. IMCC34160]